ncbi:MAG: histone deacetylase [Anaerolineae bacterium]|nr:histone deacetylase [Anaerolineae bacterium]
MKKTGYVYEDIFTQHNFPEHPENATRLAAILSYLDEHELMPKLTRIPARPATPNELQRCHHPLYIEMVEDTCRFGGGMLDGDTYTNEYSFDAAITAAGGVIDLAKAVVKGELDNGFALVRPPGHHAVPSSAMGFCLFGTAAIAARAARRDLKLDRVAVIDFDVHHGNGTQAILNEDPHIFFASSHQYPFYPGTGALREIGRGSGEGATLNIPLSVMTGDDGIKRLYCEGLFPALRRFEPQLILISAGYDAHWQDPLANIGLTLNGYRWLCEGLIALAEEICNGNIVFILEGGYNLDVLAPGVGNTFRALLGINEFDDPIGKCPWKEPDVTSLLSELKRVHRL